MLNCSGNLPRHTLGCVGEEKSDLYFTANMETSFLLKDRLFLKYYIIKGLKTTIPPPKYYWILLKYIHCATSHHLGVLINSHIKKPDRWQSSIQLYYINPASRRPLTSILPKKLGLFWPQKIVSSFKTFYELQCSEVPLFLPHSFC